MVCIRASPTVSLQSHLRRWSCCVAYFKNPGFTVYQETQNRDLKAARACKQPGITRARVNTHSDTYRLLYLLWWLELLCILIWFLLKKKNRLLWWYRQRTNTGTKTNSKQAAIYFSSLLIWFATTVVTLLIKHTPWTSLSIYHSLQFECRDKKDKVCSLEPACHLAFSLWRVTHVLLGRKRCLAYWDLLRLTYWDIPNCFLLVVPAELWVWIVDLNVNKAQFIFAGIIYII